MSYNAKKLRSWGQHFASRFRRAINPEPSEVVAPSPIFEPTLRPGTDLGDLEEFSLFSIEPRGLCLEDSLSVWRQSSFETVELLPSPPGRSTTIFRACSTISIDLDSNPTSPTALSPPPSKHVCVNDTLHAQLRYAQSELTESATKLVEAQHEHATERKYLRKLWRVRWPAEERREARGFRNVQAMHLLNSTSDQLRQPGAHARAHGSTCWPMLHDLPLPQFRRWLEVRGKFARSWDAVIEARRAVREAKRRVLAFEAWFEANGGGDAVYDGMEALFGAHGAAGEPLEDCFYAALAALFAGDDEVDVPDGENP